MNRPRLPIAGPGCALDEGEQVRQVHGTSDALTGGSGWSGVNARCFLCGVAIDSDGLALMLEEIASLSDAFVPSAAASCPGCVGPVLVLWIRKATEHER